MTLKTRILAGLPLLIQDQKDELGQMWNTINKSSQNDTPEELRVSKQSTG